MYSDYICKNHCTHKKTTHPNSKPSSWQLLNYHSLIGSIYVHPWRTSSPHKPLQPWKYRWINTQISQLFETCPFPSQTMIFGIYSISITLLFFMCFPSILLPEAIFVLLRYRPVAHLPVLLGHYGISKGRFWFWKWKLVSIITELAVHSNHFSFKIRGRVYSPCLVISGYLPLMLLYPTYHFSKMSLETKA